MSLGFQVLPKPHANDPALTALLAGIPTALLSDNMGRLFAAGPALRPMHDGTPMLGFALTVRTRPGDNLLVHKAIDMAGPGDVVVVEAGGVLTNAIIGEIMATIALKNGVAGIVIDGAIRDSDAIAAMSLPIFAAGVTHRGPYKDGPGEINTGAVIGGQHVAPGDLVVGDTDGVLAVPRAEVAAVAALARAQLAAEDATMKAIAAGTLDRSWVDATLAAKGAALGKASVY
ncbi:RraA family protein [Phreatobacter sp.]|uniref:RraA family protein n=1 Tax=Phreatobacter sp. TaxID=1966341 RepID=UPI0025E9E1DD|nr:RraA family protein [Phreatobacter sp.]